VRDAAERQPSLCDCVSIQLQRGRYRHERKRKGEAIENFSGRCGVLQSHAPEAWLR
jgi:hypothetical protein